MENKDTVFTHDIATHVVDRFEAVLDRYDITVPSPEDDDREPDNNARLYGSVYSELLEAVEVALIDVFKKAKAGAELIPDRYSGSC